MREMAAILFRQRAVLFGVFAVVLAAAVLYALFGAKYEAHMQVLVRRGRVDPPMNAQVNAPLEYTRWEVTEEELNSEVELLRDDEVLRRVAEACDLTAHDRLWWLHAGDGKAARIERAARRLGKQLKVDPVKKTNLIAISYGGSDPRLAAAVLRALAKAYLEKHVEVHRPGGEAGFFEQQAGESRRQLEEAQRKLLEFTGSHGVVAAGQERDLILRRVTEVDASYQQTQVDLEQTQRRVLELKAQLAKLPERTTTQIRAADNPELMRALKASLLDLELKRTQLLTKFEPSHRLVQEVDQQIALAKAAIANEEMNPLRDETTEKDANHEWAKGELQKAQVDLKGLEAKAETTGAQLAAYRTLARRYGEDAIAQDDLVNREKAAEESYLLYVKKREEARVGDALDERGIVNVAIAEQPAVPALPVWPAWLVVVTGVVAGGVSGAGTALARDRTDPALRTPDEALECLDLPVLASLPERVRHRLAA